MSLGRVEGFLRTSIIVFTNHTKGREDVKAILSEREHSMFMFRRTTTTQFSFFTYDLLLLTNDLRIAQGHLIRAAAETFFETYISNLSYFSKMALELP